MSNFLQPGISNPEDKFAPSENLNALLLFFPTAFTAGVKTEHGEADTVAARVVRLNDGRVYDNALIFSTALVTQLKSAVPDGMVLGTLGQGENKRGNPPWLLRPHTAEDVALAERWLAANPRNQFQQAAPTPPAAPAPQWGQQAPATPPAQGGWQAAPPAAPAAPQWGAPAAPAPSMQPSAPAPAAPQGQFEGQWGQAAAPVIDPALVAYLTGKGYPPPPGTTQATAEQMAAAIG